MNWLDFVLAIILLACVVGGVRRGLSRQVIGLVSGVLALLLGVWLYGTVGGFLLAYLSSRTLANACGFAIVFCGILLFGEVMSISSVSSSTLPDIFRRSCTGRRSRMLRGLIYSIAIIMGAMAFARGAKPPEAIVESRLAPYVVDASRLVAAMAPHELKEGFRKTYEQVKSAWSDTLEKGMRHLPNGEKKKDERQI